MTDNDPAATAALAERVAELDRQFPRREETTGRAMCAGWGPSAETGSWPEPGQVRQSTGRWVDPPPRSCPWSLRVDDHRLHCALRYGHEGAHQDREDRRDALVWDGKPPCARTPIVEPGLCTSTTVTADDAVHRCVLHAGHADVHRDGPDPHTARGWTDDAPKPRTVRDDVASVTT